VYSFVSLACFFSIYLFQFLSLPFSFIFPLSVFPLFYLLCVSLSFYVFFSYLSLSLSYFHHFYVYLALYLPSLFTFFLYFQSSFRQFHQLYAFFERTSFRQLFPRIPRTRSVHVTSKKAAETTFI